MNINFLDLKRQYQTIKNEVDAAIAAVIDSSSFVGGAFVEKFESNFAAAHSAKYCVGVNNGTSALHLTLWALGIGPEDEVIIPANTFFATPEAVSLTGAKPVFVDCDPSYYQLDPSKLSAAINSKTKAIIPVHLYGQPAPMDEIMAIAQQYNLLVVEDCAQAHLAQYKNKFVGNFGVAGCFSFYPGKNLGAYGEAGAIVTNDESLYIKLQAMKDHGALKKYHHKYIGHNYRMEGIQAAVLDVKLNYLNLWTEARRSNAEIYQELLANEKSIILPQVQNHVRHVYHLYVIRTEKRNKLMKHLNAAGIGTGIHYPIPCHEQEAYKSLDHHSTLLGVTQTYASQLLSLPMHEGLMLEEIMYVVEKIKNFFKSEHIDDTYC